RGPDGFTCAQSGPFGSGGILAPPGRNAAPTLSSFVAANGSPGLAPYYGYGNEGPKYGYVEQWNLDIQRQLPAGFFADVAYAGSHGVHLQQYQTNINQIADSFVAQAAAQAAAGATPTIDTLVPNVLTSPNTALNPAVTPMIHQGQYDRPYPEYNGLNLDGYGCCSSNYNSLQASVTRRFQGGGTLLVAYTNAKLMSNTDTLTSWLEGGVTGGVGGVQDWNNLKGERSLSSQDISQRMVASYVLDLPFGHGKRFLSGMSGFANAAVSGWGLDGITTLQRGFPVKISWGGGDALTQAGLGIGSLRPDYVAGCSKGGSGSALARERSTWFNTACFTAPSGNNPDVAHPVNPWTFGDEPRVDASLRQQGVVNFDFAVFKRTSIMEKLNVEFRAEMFDIFNHPQFGSPNGTVTSSTFGAVTNTINNSFRIVQFGLKFIY